MADSRLYTMLFNREAHEDPLLENVPVKDRKYEKEIEVVY